MAMDDSFRGLKATLEASNSDTHQLLEHLGDKVQDLSGLSSEQSETLIITCNAILNLLKQHVFDKPHCCVTDPSESASTKGHQGIYGDGEIYKILDEDEDDIRECLDRLCQLAKETEKTVVSEDAETIINDLQRLFDLLSMAEMQSAKDSKGKRRRESFESKTDDEVLQQRRGVKRMKSLLTSSQCIALNGKGTYALSSLGQI